MHRIALVNQKGGVGKTTTAVNLSACLASLGRRVLLVDLDPQANTSVSFGIRPDEGQRSSYNVIRGDCPPAKALLSIRPNLDLLPSSIDLAGAEVELAGVIGRECALRDALCPLDQYDYVLVDCPPSLGLLNVNALAFVSEVYIPLQCEYFALHGVSLLLKTIELVKRRINPTLELRGIIPCMYDGRTGLSREVVSEIEKHFQGRVFKTRIRTNVRLAEAPSHGLSIIEYAPESNGALDYLALAREVMALNGDPLPEAAAPAVEREKPEPAKVGEGVRTDQPEASSVEATAPAAARSAGSLEVADARTQVTPAAATTGLPVEHALQPAARAVAEPAKSETCPAAATGGGLQREWEVSALVPDPVPPAGPGGAPEWPRSSESSPRSPAL
ncbi:MAG: ParA family protein [Planctomycetes bacterium]|nr:ParA family protein [Planctomycetota bacterium]